MALFTDKFCGCVSQKGSCSVKGFCFGFTEEEKHVGNDFSISLSPAATVRLKALALFALEEHHCRLVCAIKQPSSFSAKADLVLHNVKCRVEAGSGCRVSMPVVLYNNYIHKMTAMHCQNEYDSF